MIGSVDDYVLDYFPDYKIKRGEKTIQKVTLKNLLTMTAPYKYKSEPWSKICVQEDWSIAALDFLGGRRGITGEFQYSTLGIHILTGIIATVSKMTTVDFANKYLFEPLKIAPRKIYAAPNAEEHKAFTVGKTPKGKIWFSDDKGVGAAGYGLCLSADEMSKIGLLCLKKGAFNNKRIVSEKWLEESTTVRLHCGEKFRDMKYGYLWWIIDENAGSYAAFPYPPNTENRNAAFFMPSCYAAGAEKPVCLYFTVTLQDAFFPLFVRTVTVVFPFFFAFMRPHESTDATFLLELFHLTVSVEFAGFSVAFRE